MSEQTTDRPDRLYWVGALLEDGRPVEWYADIPARDLDGDDLAALSDEQVNRAMDSPLYQKSEPTGERAAELARIRQALAARDLAAATAPATEPPTPETPGPTAPETDPTTGPEEPQDPPKGGTGRRTPGSKE